jgi:3-dehydroquinate synthase
VAESFSLRIASSGGDYDVDISTGLFAEVIERGQFDAVVSDRYFLPKLQSAGVPVIAVEADEGHKNLATVEEVVVGFKSAGLHRASRVLAVGGGVVQDVATLAASLYMRGIAWTYMPTTLMAMADSCIGGKSSINAGGMKNLIGNIYPPTSVLIDPDFIESLSAEGIAGGMSEAVKICFCRGPEAFDRYLELTPAASTPEGGAPWLHHVLTSKQWFIEIDEFDRKERRLLNFGHTFGHAMEAGVGFSISHGLAVSLGILSALRFTADSGGADLIGSPLDAHCKQLVEMVPDVGERLALIDIDQFEAAFRHDKKHGSDGLHLILPAVGRGVEEVVVADLEPGVAAARKAVESVVSEVTS